MNRLRYLELSAREIDSFYGVVSRYALGQKINISFDLPKIHDAFLRGWLSGLGVIACLRYCS